MEQNVIEKFSLNFGDSIVVKVGSNVLAGESNGLNKKNLENIVNGIDYLMKKGLNVFLVSSGAVAVGRSIMEKKGKNFSKKLTDDEKAFLAQIGQVKLINFYEELFDRKNIIIGQNLLTHKNFKDKNILENLKKVWRQNIKNQIVTILNENDVVSREELKFSDNDELAGLVAKEIKAKVLVLLSNIDGVYKNFGEENQEIIAEIKNIEDVYRYSKEVKSENGTGGMKSKLNVMEKMINAGIIGVLANGNIIGIIEDIFGKGNYQKTVFKR